MNEPLIFYFILVKHILKTIVYPFKMLSLSVDVVEDDYSWLVFHPRSRPSTRRTG